MRVKAALKSDITFQFKQGFYIVYVFITLLYLLILHYIPQGTVRSYAVPLIIFSDPTVIGFFFIGAIVMLEKQQGVLDCLAVTPLSPTEYLISKVLSLAVPGLLSSAAIAVFTKAGVSYPLLIVSVLLNSCLYTMLGFIAAGGALSVNHYFMRAIPIALIAVIPCFSLIGFPFSWIFKAIPTVSGLEFLLGAFLPYPPLSLALDGAVLLVGIAAVFRWALHIYDRKILTGGKTNE